MSADSSQDGGTASDSRRGLLRAAGAGLAGVLIAGCGRQSLRAQVQNSKPILDTDVELLNRLLHLERLGIAAYTAATPLLAPDTIKAGKLFLNDELSHAGALAGLIRAAGAKPVKPAPSYELGHPRTSREVLALLHEIEQAQIAAYLAALPRLAPASVRQSVVSIMANDAQHLTVVRAALGQVAVPSAFVTGRE